MGERDIYALVFDPRKEFNERATIVGAGPVKVVFVATTQEKREDYLRGLKRGKPRHHVIASFSLPHRLPHR